MRGVVLVAVAYMSSVVAATQTIAADRPPGVIRGHVTDQAGTPLKNVVLVLEAAAPLEEEDVTRSRRWARTDDTGTFESALPADFTLVGVLPACYDIIDLKRSATDLELVLSRVDAARDTPGENGPGGSATAFASVSSPSTTSSGRVWTSRGSLAHTRELQQAPGATAPVARAAVASSTGGTFPSTTSSAIGVGALRWQAGFPSVSTTGLGGVNGHLNTAFSRSWTVSSSSTGSGLGWHPPKGIQATATPDCARWRNAQEKGARP
jgi:hypothetical protein